MPGEGLESEWDEPFGMREERNSPGAVRNGSERFETPGDLPPPRSWEMGGRGARTEGPVPMEVERPVRQAYREVPEDSFEREVERGMVEHLVDENERLRREVLRLQTERSSDTVKGVAGRAKGEVSGEGGDRGQRQHQSPVRPTQGRGRSPPRFTPQGTRIPEGPPPVEDAGIPEFPIPHVENEAWNTLTSQETRDTDWTFVRSNLSGAEMRNGIPGGLQMEQQNLYLGSQWVRRAPEPERSNGPRERSRSKHAGDREGSRAGMVRGGQEGLYLEPYQGGREGNRAVHGGDREGLRAYEQPGLYRLPSPLRHDPRRAPVVGQRGGGDPTAGPVWGEAWTEGGRPGPQQPGGVVSSAEARTLWLEREVQALQAKLERVEQRGGAYWSHPVLRTEEPTCPPPPPPPEKPEAEKKEEWLRAVPIQLPRLVEPTVQHAALEAGDWLAQIRPMIGDVSEQATRWWDCLVAITEREYRRWLASNPLEKLQVKAPDRSQTSEGFVRLDQRVTTLLMSSLPDSVKQDLVATRQLHAAGVLFCILRKYQPGGLNEKTATLAALTQTSEASGPIEAADSLRLWQRQVNRVKELGATLPDPTLLVRALDVIMRGVLNQNPQASFRVSSFRLAQQIDVSPDERSVYNLHEMLLAEAEVMLYAKADNTAITGKHGETPMAKALISQAQPRQASGSQGNVCKWWGTSGGCRKGKQCGFVHEQLADAALRCWVCSSTEHRKTDCPYRQDAVAKGTGGSDAQGEGHKATGGPKGKGDGSKGKGKSKKDSKGHQGQGEGKATYGSSQPREGEEKGTPMVKSETVVNQEGQVNGAEQGLMTEVTSLLKSLRMAGDGAQIRVCQVKKLTGRKAAYTLLDGGATHCLRQRASEKEWEAAHPVKVKLATGEVELKQVVDTGTLLSEDDVQPLIPLEVD